MKWNNDYQGLESTKFCDVPVQKTICQKNEPDQNYNQFKIFYLTLFNPIYNNLNSKIKFKVR